MKDKKKIIIAVVLAIVILAVGIVVGVMIRRNIPTQQEEITTSATTTTTTTATTTTTTEPSTEATSTTTQASAPDVTVKFVDREISNTDKNNFRDAVGEILANGFYEDNYVAIGDDYKYNLTSYNYKSSDAKRYAYSRLLVGVAPLIEQYQYIYNYYVHIEEFTDENDPKGLIDYYYYCVDAEDVDLLLETTFNVKPDHNYILRSKDGTVHAYYHDGKYYVRIDEGGTFDNECRINNIKLQADGTYLIDGTYYNSGENLVDMKKICDVKVVAEMKNVKGRSFWSVYSIEKA